MCPFWPCGSIAANPIIYRLVPSPSRFENRQCLIQLIYMFFSGLIFSITINDTYEHTAPNFLFWFLGIKSFHSHYKRHHEKNTNNKHRKQKRSTCFIQQLGREHTPNEQVIPLTKHQRTVSAEDQSLAKGDDITSLVDRILQPVKNRVNWKQSRILKTTLELC